MRTRSPGVLAVLAVGLFACGGIKPGESGIRGKVPEGADPWVPATGGLLCASTHEMSTEPACTKVRGDGVFELPLPPGTYWLCARRKETGPLRCSSLCPYVVRAGEVTEVDPSDLRALKPEGQGFFGTSTGSFGEHGYLNVPHPLQVCVGPPGTGIHTPTSALTCARTDRCGRYQLPVPEGSYRVLFAEHEETTTSERQRCLYRVDAGQTIAIDRVTGRGRDRDDGQCGEGGAPDPVIGEELTRIVHEVAGMEPEQVPAVVRAELERLTRDQLRAGRDLAQLASSLHVEEAWLLPVVANGLARDAELRAKLPPFIVTGAKGIAFPQKSEDDDDKRVRLRGLNFLGERGTVTLRPLAGGASFEVADADVLWDWYEIVFPAPEGPPGARYEVTVTRPNGLSSLPRGAVIVIGKAPPPMPVECVLDPMSKKCKEAAAQNASEGPEKLALEDVQQAIAPIKPGAGECGPKHGAAAGTEVRVTVDVAGATGEVVSVRSADEHAGTPLFECVAAAVKQAKFPRFSREKQSFTHMFKM